MEKTGVPGENPRPAASHWQTLSHDVVEFQNVGRGCILITNVLRKFFFPHYQDKLGLPVSKMFYNNADHQSYLVTGNTNITQQCVFACYLDNISK